MEDEIETQVETQAEDQSQVEAEAETQAEDQSQAEDQPMEPPTVDPAGDLRAAVAQLVDGYGSHDDRVSSLEAKVDALQGILRRQGWKVDP